VVLPARSQVCDAGHFFDDAVMSHGAPWHLPLKQVSPASHGPLADEQNVAPAPQEQLPPSFCSAPPPPESGVSEGALHFEGIPPATRSWQLALSRQVISASDGDEPQTDAQRELVLDDGALHVTAFAEQRA
jgi:hypothetical protein